MGAANVNPAKEVAIHKYTQSLMGKPFEYGVNDCPLFAAGVLDILANTAIRDSLIGAWSDQRGAWKYQKQHGGFYDHLVGNGCVEVEFHSATTGDFFVMEQKLAHEKKWHSIAVCLGLNTALVTTEAGVTLIKTHDVPNIGKVLRYVGSE